MTTEHDSPGTADSPPFGCEVLREREAARVRPTGALDMATAPLLRERLEELRADGARRLTVDLSELSFMDSTGLRLLLSEHAEARRDGFTLAIVPGPPAVQRVFLVTGTLDCLPFGEG